MSILGRKKPRTGKVLGLDGKAHDTYGSVTKAELYAALEAIEALVFTDEVCDWETRASSEDGGLNEREREMTRVISDVYRLAHAWNPMNSCFDRHGSWRAEIVSGDDCEETR